MFSLYHAHFPLQICNIFFQKLIFHSSFYHFFLNLLPFMAFQQQFFIKILQLIPQLLFLQLQLFNILLQLIDLVLHVDFQHFFLVLEFLGVVLEVVVVLLESEELGFEFGDDGLVVGGVFGLVFGQGDEDVEVGLLQHLNLLFEMSDLTSEGVIFFAVDDLQIFRTSKSFHNYIILQKQSQISNSMLL